MNQKYDQLDDVWNQDVQKYLLSHLLKDAEAFRLCNSIIKDEYFDGQITRAVRYIKRHFEAAQSLPDRELVHAKTGAEFGYGVDLPELTEPVEREWLISQVVQFCRYKATENTILEGIDLLRNGKGEEVEARMKEARAITVNPNPVGLTDICDISLSNLEPRRWCYRDFLVRGFVSALAGPGGTGKTSVALAIALSVALGRDLLALDDEEDRVKRQGAVLYWNLEDPLDEMKLRIAAEIKHRHIDQAKLKGQFFVLSGRDHPLCVAERNAKGKVEVMNITPVVQMLREHQITTLVVDPLVNAHRTDGNSNSDLAIVVDQFRKIAHEADCALLLVQHFRKGGQGGDVEASLGAVTLTNGCRVVETLTAMSEDDARALGIDPQNRRRYVKRDNAKMNLSAAPTQCEWLEFNSVPLDNGTDEYPDGDHIGVLSRWKQLSPLCGLSWDAVSKVLDMIDAGFDREYYTPAPQAKRWAGNLLMMHLGLNKEQSKALIKEWRDAGILNTTTYNSPSGNYAPTTRLYVVPDGKSKLADRMASRA